MSRAVADRIEIAPGVCSGKPRIAGTRIRVQDIAAWHEIHGRSPDEIASGYPHLSLADIYAALAYYHAHRDEIVRDMREDEEFVADFKAAYQRSHPACRATGTDADGNLLPP
jgi:uncharacterized protein (DUF433 family)